MGVVLACRRWEDAVTLLVWWLEAYLSWGAGLLTVSTHTAGGWQLQQTESPALPTRVFAV